MNSVDGAVVFYLMYVLVPLWLASGLADWWCHRRDRIELSTGPAESGIHLLMLVEMGIPALLALFCEINALVFAVALLAFVLHEATALWDVSYAAQRRLISPFEQHVHSFLEIIPLMAVSCMAFLHLDQFLALLGIGAAPDFSPRLKREPLPAAYTMTLLAAIALVQIGPFLEEFWRTLRARRLLAQPVA